MLLQIAEDTYRKDRLKDPLVKQKLVDISCDCLKFHSLRMKILHEKPRHLESAIQVAYNARFRWLCANKTKDKDWL